MKDSGNIILQNVISDDDKLSADSPFTLFVRYMLMVAKKFSASDIHLEPTQAGITVRFRRHGILSQYKKVNEKYREGIITATKRAVNMDLATIGRPQDSRASFKSLGLDVRASALPYNFGDKIVLRLFSHKTHFDLASTGLSVEAQRALSEAIQQKNGLILISGPTGSGKTTTLYSLLSKLPKDKLNISTIENPIEYNIQGVNQVNIKENGISFDSALRALMRQDPDIILIGEIRDAETATLAFRAASTGHLVLSTVHANGAKAVIERLKSLGIDNFSIQNNLRFSAAQRLIPLLCAHCALEEKNNFKRQNPKGCKICYYHGVTGRVAVLEWLNGKDIRDGQNLRFPIKEVAGKLATQGKIDYREVTHI